jgi:predicted O-linked N-acetylglucosamine transferase (SPINDLY family)
MDLQQQIEFALSHHRAGRLTEAEKVYRQILAIDPNYFDALHLLGALAGQMGQLDAALELIGRAIRVNPDLAIAHNNLGNILRDKGRASEAIASFREAIRLKPDFAEAHNNLGISLDLAGQRDEAIASFRQAIRLQPNLSESHSNLANALVGRGEFDEAIALQREAIRLKPDYPAAHSDLVCAMLSHPGYDARMIFEELSRWNERYAQPLGKFIQPHTNDRNPDRRLRIGYVSADFRDRHVVGRCLLPFLREHDRGQVEIFLYANVVDERASAGQFQRYADAWRNIKGLTDSQAVDLIRQDRIDILIDLALHSDGNRLTVFARKPAPVQVTYLGYCASTGLDTIDYRLSDPNIDPPGSDLSVYSERTFLLPETYWCYSTSEATPDPSPPPAASAGYITFGCLNSFGKVSRAAQDLWAEILRVVPQSRLIIHSAPGIHVNAVRERFVAKGISPDRLEFVGKQPWAQYVATYSRIDIALDPFPWSGGVTTCDALWMGVPVVSLVGRTSVGRGGKSILTNIGMSELIAQTPEQYVHIAAALAGNLPRLAELRGILRQRMQASPLLDAPRFARNMEAAYRQMWRSWCAGSGNSTLPMPDRSALQKQFESGMSHHRAGRLAEAERIYRQVLAQQPNHADVLHRLGMLEDQLGRPDVGVELIQRAIELQPNLAGAHSNLGNALTHSGRFDEAIASHRIALRLDPNDAASQNNLGAALANTGQLEEAIALFQRAIRLAPNFAEAHGNLGDALAGMGRLDDAIAAYREVARLRPDFADAYNNLGNALVRGGKLDESIDAFHRAIALKPNFPEAYSNLGVAYKDKGQFDEAVAASQEAIRLKPDFADAHSNLGSILAEQGRIAEAIGACRAAIQLNPDIQDYYINLLYALYHDPESDSRRLLGETRQWARRQSGGTQAYSPERDRTPERRLRIGYLSQFFRMCADAHFIVPLLANHDRKQFEIFCYPATASDDELIDRLRGHSDHWHDIHHLGTPAAVELIRSHQLDILVTMSRPADKCLMILANRLAPVQINWMTFASCTTGLDTVDYRISDPYLDPAEAIDLSFTEKTVALPETAWCYDPLLDSPAINPLPAMANGFVTFGSLNRLSKINPVDIAAWAEVLRAVPNSRLRVLAAVGSHRQRLLTQMQESGVDTGRIEFIDRQSRFEYLQQYGRIDITLDTFPFSGHTTALDSLWMGVPVVTLSGRTSVGRAACSALQNLGLAELIGQTREEYVSIAAGLAGDLPRLAEIRRTLRSRMQASPLMDAPRFARNMEAAHREMWRKWCERSS